MRNLRWPFLIICLMAFIVAIPLIGFAQPGDPPNPDAPITGIEILVGLGSLFGIKKIMQNRKGKQD